MINAIKLWIFKARAMVWMVIIQRRFARGMPRIWSTAPLDIVAMFAGFSPEIPPTEEADESARAAWRAFILLARAEKTQRLTKLMDSIQKDLA